MAKCNYCGRKGWGVKITKNGLCVTCDRPVMMGVGRHWQIIEESLKLIRESKNFDTRISRCSVVEENLQYLTDYEKKGVTIGGTEPSKRLKEWEKTDRDNALLTGLKRQTLDVEAKVKLASTVAAKINLLSKLLLAVQEHRPHIRNKTVLDALEAEIQKGMREIKLGDFLGQAKKAEFKGQKKKALDQYQEALYLVRTDNIDDAKQRHEIAMIEAKIAEFSEGPAKPATSVAMPSVPTDNIPKVAFCSQCGANTAPSDRFCQSCGNKLG